jgi:hypothetical protein
VTGKRIVIASWATLALFAIVAIPAALGLDALDRAVTAVSLAWFGVSLVVWIYAFGYAVVRSARGDDIVVASWVFLQGSAPARVRNHLLWATAASIVVAGIGAIANPFAVLEPMLQLGFAALWGARHGTFPPRRTTGTSRPARVAKGGAR